MTLSKKRYNNVARTYMNSLIRLVRKALIPSASILMALLKTENGEVVYPDLVWNALGIEWELSRTWLVQ